MGSYHQDQNHRAIQAAQGIDPDTPEATRAREIAMFGAQEAGAKPAELDYPVAAPADIAPIIFRSMIIQTMALEYMTYMRGAPEPFTLDEAFEAAYASWGTDWPDDPAPRTIEAGIQVAQDDLSYWGEE